MPRGRVTKTQKDSQERLRLGLGLRLRLTPMNLLQHFLSDLFGCQKYEVTGNNSDKVSFEELYEFVAVEHKVTISKNKLGRELTKKLGASVKDGSGVAQRKCYLGIRLLGELDEV